MTAENSNTIIALKSNFLRQQVRILSQPLKPSEKWKDRSDIPESDLSDAIKRANEKVRRHNKTVYDRIAIRHVAEQIDGLYWQAGEPYDLLDGELYGEDILRQDDDLTLDENIAKLEGAFAEDETTEEFTNQLQRLEELQSRRAAIRKKLAAYRQLQALLKPFKDPQNSIQPNLATRDGALADELAKSKALGIRVAGRVAGLSDRAEGDAGGTANGDDEMIIDENEKVAAVLGMR